MSINDNRVNLYHRSTVTTLPKNEDKHLAYLNSLVVNNLRVSSVVLGIVFCSLDT